MPRKIIALALVGALLTSQWAAAARLSEHAVDTPHNGERGAATNIGASAARYDLQLPLGSLDQVGPQALQDFEPKLEVRETDRPGEIEKTAFATLETAVSAQPKSRNEDVDTAAQDNHWNGVFHGAVETPSSESLDLDTTEPPASQTRLLQQSPTSEAPISAGTVPTPRFSRASTLYSSIILPFGLSLPPALAANPLFAASTPYLFGAAAIGAAWTAGAAIEGAARRFAPKNWDPERTQELARYIAWAARLALGAWLMSFILPTGLLPPSTWSQNALFVAAWPYLLSGAAVGTAWLGGAILQRAIHRFAPKKWTQKKAEVVASTAGWTARILGAGSLISLLSRFALDLPKTWTTNPIFITLWPYLVGGAAVGVAWFCGTVVGRAVDRFAPKSWKPETTHALSVRLVWGARIVAAGWILSAWSGIDGAVIAAVLGFLGVFVSPIITFHTNDRIYGTALEISHPLQANERIRVEHDSDEHKDYLFQDITTDQIVFKDAETGRRTFYFTSQFILKPFSVFRSDIRPGRGWIRLLSIPEKLASSESKTEPKPWSSLIPSGLLTVGLLTGAYFLPHWLAPVSAGLAFWATWQATHFSASFINIWAARRDWEPRAANRVSNILTIGIYVVGAHLVLLAGGVSLTTVLAFFTATIGTVAGIVANTVLLPIRRESKLKKIPELAPGRRVSVGPYVGVVQAHILYYMILKLDDPTKDGYFVYIPHTYVIEHGFNDAP